MGTSSPARAVRVRVGADAKRAHRAEDVRSRALELGLLGWVREADDGTLELHAEGGAEPIDALSAFLRDGPRRTEAPDRAGAEHARTLELSDARVEGHEQFAIRGVSAGVFVVQEHSATAHHFDLRLEVEGVMRSWAVPKGPSMDPAVKRLAVQVEDHEMQHNEFEGPTQNGAVVIWDRGTYEQGGRVAWPEALERGHAVFVLHGEKLHGGFALQRTRPAAKPQWLLLKRSDEEARPGSDVVAERPASVISGRTLDQLLGDAASRGNR